MNITRPLTSPRSSLGCNSIFYALLMSCIYSSPTSRGISHRWTLWKTDPFTFKLPRSEPQSRSTRNQHAHDQTVLIRHQRTNPGPGYLHISRSMLHSTPSALLRITLDRLTRLVRGTPYSVSEQALSHRSYRHSFIPPCACTYPGRYGMAIYHMFSFGPRPWRVRHAYIRLRLQVARYDSHMAVCPRVQVVWRKR